LGDAPDFDSAVLDDLDSMAEPLGSAPSHRASDAREATRLASMERETEACLGDQTAGSQVTVRWVASFRPCQVEGHHSNVASSQGEPGDGFGIVHLPESTEDQSPGGPCFRLALPQSGGHRLDDSIRGMSAIGVQHRPETHLGMNDSCLGHIYEGLVSDPLESLLGLHLGQGHSLPSRKIDPMLGCQFEHSLWSEPPIEMIVEKHRRQGHPHIVVVEGVSKVGRR
jgi:hypothetical protein